MLTSIVGLLGPLLKWLLLAVWEMKEKAREGVEVAPDPARYDRLRRYERL